MDRSGGWGFIIGILLAVVGIFLVVEADMGDRAGTAAAVLSFSGFLIGISIPRMLKHLEGEAHNSRHEKVVEDLTEARNKAVSEITKLKDEMKTSVSGEAFMEEVDRSEELEDKIEKFQKENANLKSQINDLEKTKAPGKDYSQELDELRQQLKNAKENHKEEIEILYAQLENVKLESQNELASAISAMTVPDFVSALNKRLDKVSANDLKGENQVHMLSLYNKMKAVYADNGLVDIDKLANASAGITRISGYEAIIDHFSYLINQANKDDSLDEDIREEKVNAYRRLMDREISAMEGNGQ